VSGVVLVAIVSSVALLVGFSCFPGSVRLHRCAHQQHGWAPGPRRCRAGFPRLNEPTGEAVSTPGSHNQGSTSAGRRPRAPPKPLRPRHADLNRRVPA
jgi:hypothetical protein